MSAELLRGSVGHFTYISTMIHDSYTWAQTLPHDYHWQAGLTRERETELLEAWEGYRST